jgi:hypothetical protein
MIRNVVVNYKGLLLNCRGYYSPYKDNGYDNPPDYECFEIDTIHYNDTDVTELVNVLNIDWCDLESLCIESLKDQ